ncbi:MAG: hypothetical protein HYS17_05770 [Micavibrio aeruginosavorus]|uniref:EF-hand domain-containing protein n=1 Tax=Micavibrio aeruginosavorus TaxID=349221 RepID=A0A7T5R486_9BACT|nr:MAG: hypothetical protein HYS17_05770 [Micavibrio aeruginosavorus]
MKFFLFALLAIVIMHAEEACAAEAILPIGVRLISMDEYHQMTLEENSPLQPAAFQQEIHRSQKDRMFNRLFDNLDQDQDSVITNQEFTNSMNGKGQALFNALDADGDHLVERHEIEDYSELYVRLGRRS